MFVQWANEEQWSYFTRKHQTSGSLIWKPIRNTREHYKNTQIQMLIYFSEPVSLLSSSILMYTKFEESHTSVMLSKPALFSGNQVIKETPKWREIIVAPEWPWGPNGSCFSLMFPSHYCHAFFFYLFVFWGTRNWTYDIDACQGGAMPLSYIARQTFLCILF